MYLNSCLMTNSEKSKLERQITKVKFIIASSKKINKRLGIRINSRYDKTLRTIKEVVTNITGTKDYIMSKEEAYRLLEDIIGIIREESKQGRKYDILVQNINVSSKAIAIVIDAPVDLIKSMYLTSIHKFRNKTQIEILQKYIVNQAEKQNWSKLYSKYLIRRSNGNTKLANLKSAINQASDGGKSLLQIERKLSNILRNLLHTDYNGYTIKLSHLCKFLDVNRGLAQRLTKDYNKTLKQVYLPKISLKTINTSDKQKLIELFKEYKSICRQATGEKKKKKINLHIQIVDLFSSMMEDINISESPTRYSILEKKLNLRDISREWIFSMFYRYENKKEIYNKLNKELNLNEHE